MTTKSELIIFYAEHNNIKDLNEAEKKLDQIIESLKSALSKNKTVIFRNFGSFEVRQTNERDIMNPKIKGNVIHAKPKKYVKFKVSRSLEKNLCLKCYE